MVLDLLSRGFAGRLGFGDGLEEIALFGIAKQVLKIASEPILHSILCLLGVPFEHFSE